MVRIIQEKRGAILSNVVHVNFKGKTKALVSESLFVPTKEDKEKRREFEERIEGNIVYTVFRKDDSNIIPKNLCDLSTVALKWSLNYNITDLSITEKGISGTLSYKGIQMYTSIPWRNILLIYTEGEGEGRGAGWIS